jgi:AcrR family transcriptional regulator
VTIRTVAKEALSRRDAILDATEALMVEEGYAAVTSRRVAEKAGLKSKLVHYYFATMDELFVALYERTEKQYLQRHLQAANAANPLRAIWELSIHPQRTLLSQELIDLSNHRPAIRRITTRVTEQVHAINTAAIARYLRELGANTDEYPPAVISKMIVSLSRLLVREVSLGIEPGHVEIHAFVDQWFSRLEQQKA